MGTARWTPAMGWLAIDAEILTMLPPFPWGQHLLRRCLGQ